jgi:hypothetical protein
MDYPPLLRLASAAQYRAHFENIYCRGPIATFDGIEVRFRKRDFNHSFFESKHRNSRKDDFSLKRAERMDWIKTALRDPDAERYLGWDKRRRTYVRSRRVTVVMSNYVVVIALKSEKKADFVTAFVADTAASPNRPSTVDLVRRGPKWA